jgi:endonuclease III
MKNLFKMIIKFILSQTKIDDKINEVVDTAKKEIETIKSNLNDLNKEDESE